MFRMRPYSDYPNGIFCLHDLSCQVQMSEVKKEFRLSSVTTGFVWTKKYSPSCVCTYRPYPNSGSASFRGCIWRPVMSHTAQRLSQFKGSLECSPQMQPSFTSLWRMRRHYHLRDVRVKHMLTQHNVPKARPSHLATVDTAFKGLSKGLAFEDHKGRVLRRMQPLNWDKDIVLVLYFHSICKWSRHYCIPFYNH